MNIEVGKTYITKCRRYKVTVKTIGDKYLEGTYVYIYDDGKEEALQSTRRDWNIDGTFGSRVSEHNMDLIEEFYDGPAPKLCNCAWNKHPLFCKCK